MKTVYDSHVVKLRDVRLDRDLAPLLEILQSSEGDSVIARIRHRGGTLEFTDPSKDFAERMRIERIDPRQPIDLELITRGPSRRPAVPSGDILGVPLEDPNDLNTLHWNGFRGTGEIVSNQIRHTPMFFRENGMNLDLVDLHAGRSLFLVLNGPSLTGFDWARLKQPGICTFGINNGAHLLRPNFWTSVDDPSRFMESIWRDPTITKFVPMSHFQKPIWDRERNTFSRELVRSFPNVVGYRRNEAFSPDKWLIEDTINWGNHSKRGGGRSVMLASLRIAFLLGFRKVYLLGCDFYMDETKHYWFPEQRSANAISNNTNSYSLMRGFFNRLQPKFLEAGFEVFNCNPQSGLESFPFADLEEALGSAKIDTEVTTEGMYIDRHREEKRRGGLNGGGDGLKGRNVMARKEVGQRRGGDELKRALPKPHVNGHSKIVHVSPHRESARGVEGPLGQLLESLESVAISDDPFVHFRVQNAFSESFYAELLSRLPEDKYYSELKHHDAMQSDGRSARLFFGFSARELARLDSESRDFWSGFRTMLMDRRLEAVIRRLLATGLERRFGEKATRVSVTPVPMLIRDLSGYRIRVHTDIFQKVITSQFYLPEDDSRPELGTTFCKRKKDGTAKDAFTLPFLPRTGYAFAVGEDSLHQVRRLELGDRPRNSLMLTYYLKES
jgi:hypothetical protein